MSWRNKKDKEENNRDELPEEFPFNFFQGGFFGNIFDTFLKNIEVEMRSIENNEKTEVFSRQYGPYYWGRMMTIGPDGNPIIKEYSNITPNQEQIPESVNDVNDHETLIDAFIEDETVRIIVELPGVNKEAIDIKATESDVTLTAHTELKNYYANKELSVKIKPKTAKATYTNGILEVIFERKEPKETEEEFEVKIE